MQPQPNTPIAARRGALDLEKRLENTLYLCWGNANPRVADADRYPSLLTVCLYCNAALLSELDRVADEVLDDHLQFPWVRM